jgi:hypothetical protein
MHRYPFVLEEAALFCTRFPKLCLRDSLELNEQPWVVCFESSVFYQRTPQSPKSISMSLQ